jgi:hypothetical protein
MGSIYYVFRIDPTGYFYPRSSRGTAYIVNDLNHGLSLVHPVANFGAYEHAIIRF